MKVIIEELKKIETRSLGSINTKWIVWVWAVIELDYFVDMDVNMDYLYSLPNSLGNVSTAATLLAEARCSLDFASLIS